MATPRRKAWGCAFTLASIVVSQVSREQAYAAKIASLIKGASGKDLARFEAVARAYFGRARSGVTGKAARDP